jgi:hypothetical protein
MNRGVHLFLVGSLALVPVATSAQAPGRGAGSIDDVVEWMEPLVLEETPEALNAYPQLAIDPEGGYLVTDRQLAQVRVYGPDGALVSYFGREGDGPGEFRNLRGVARLSTGELCTVDFEGRLALWDQSGELIVERRLPIIGAMGIAPLEGSQVAVVTSPVAARPDSMDVPWLRLVNIQTLDIGPEILSLPLTLQNLSTASSVETGLNPTLGTKFGLTWSIFDSLWVVDLTRPDERRSMKLESDALGLNTRPVDRFDDREGFVNWMLTATFPGAAFQAPGGGWLVALFRREGRGASWSVLRVDESGRRIWEREETPRLVATDPDGGILYFEEPTGLAPNRFNRARVKN